VAVTVDYTWYGKLENELKQRGYLTRSPEFTDQVRIVCLPESADADRFIAWMTDLTQGRAVIEPGSYVYVDREA